MFGLSPLAIKAIVIGLLFSLGCVAIYQWRADIKQTAYDAIFKEQVENHLAEQKKAIKRLEEVNVEKEKALVEQLAKAKELEKKLADLDKEFKLKNFKNLPLDPGLQFTLDQIRQLEAERQKGVAR
jgi:hypothetical protein